MSSFQQPIGAKYRHMDTQIDMLTLRFLHIYLDFLRQCSEAGLYKVVRQRINYSL